MSNQLLTINNGYNTIDIVDTINKAVAEGHEVEVNGRKLVGRKPAVSWGTGSISVTVPAKAKGRSTELFVKVGEHVQIAY